MTRAHRPRAALLLAVCACALAIAWLVCLPRAARAAEPLGYGELTRFGEVASGGREAEAKAGHLSEARTLAIGVDPAEENSVFVLEDQKREEVNEAGQIVSFLRLKKFAPSKGQYSEVASAELEWLSPHLHGSETDEKLGVEKPGVAGLAVDAKTGRIYFLTSDLREEGKIDAVEENNNATIAASTLYAFSTKETGKKLEPASGTKDGVVTSALEPESDSKGVSLLDPQGMTVDPANDEVIILAHIDESGAAVDNLASNVDHYVLQRVKPNGELGLRYVDKTNKLKETGAEGTARHPSSPVVVPGPGGKESEERVLVDFDGVTEIPESFSSSEPPKVLPLSGPYQGSTSEVIERGLFEAAELSPYHEYGEARLQEGGRLSA